MTLLPIQCRFRNSGASTSGSPGVGEIPAGLTLQRSRCIAMRFGFAKSAPMHRNAEFGR